MHDQRQPLGRADRIRRRRRARSRLNSIADEFLAHDRPIHRRCEDSVVRAGFPIRRSRGYAPGRDSAARRVEPAARRGRRRAEEHVLRRTRESRPSSRPTSATSTPRRPHRAFRTDLALYLEMLGVEARAGRSRPPPRLSLDSLGARAGRGDRGGPASPRPRRRLSRRARGDRARRSPSSSTAPGYGTDGTLWGGELLRCDLGDFERVAHLEPVPLPGGEAAIREPWRTAASYLETAGRPVPFERWPQVAREPQGERAALLGDGPPLRCGLGAARASGTR